MTCIDEQQRIYKPARGRLYISVSSEPRLHLGRNRECSPSCTSEAANHWAPSRLMRMDESLGSTDKSSFWAEIEAVPQSSSRRPAQADALIRISSAQGSRADTVKNIGVGGWRVEWWPGGGNLLREKRGSTFLGLIL